MTVPRETTIESEPVAEVGPSPARRMFFTSRGRYPERVLVVEFNPYQILAALVTRERRGNAVLQAAAEFNREDNDGLRRWIEANESDRKSAGAVCGLVPSRSIVQRETVQPQQLADPQYLSDLLEERRTRRAESVTPFKIFNPRTWTVRAVSATDGTALPVSGAAGPALLCAIPNIEVLEVQQRLVDSRITRQRVEPSLLSLFGSVYGMMRRRGGSQAVVIAVIQRTTTAVYILGKEGVHTPAPLAHGFTSILEMSRKQLGEIDEAEVLIQLQIANPELVNHAPKLVRLIARDLKPVVDSFEMTTGQPVDEVFCAYLPRSLGWVAERLAQAIGRVPLPVDCAEWMPKVGLEVAEGGPTFAPHWLGALSLAANLPDNSGLSFKGKANDSNWHRPWHVDCSVPMGTDDSKWSDRPFLVGTIAATIAVFALVFAAWQFYVARTLTADVQRWSDQMAGNQKLFNELNTTRATLSKQSAVLDQAHYLMGQPYQLTQLLLNLGRTVPARMRIDRIQINDLRVAMSGVLLEPAEDASITLGRHMDHIRRHAELGPLFSRVAITSLERKGNTESVHFELTLWFNDLKP